MNPFYAASLLTAPNRPGLPDFLKRIAEIYEMHVYTMGTRAYAIEVCKVIDPDGGLFGGRILSRDESGSESRWLFTRHGCGLCSPGFVIPPPRYDA